MPSDTGNNMSGVMDSQGEYINALDRFMRALDGCEKAPGKENPSTVATGNNMANVFFQGGEYTMALEWYQYALDRFEKTLGNLHPSTLATVPSMATVFDGQGQCSQWARRASFRSELAWPASDRPGR